MNGLIGCALEHFCRNVLGVRIGQVTRLEDDPVQVHVGGADGRLYGVGFVERVAVGDGELEGHIFLGFVDGPCAVFRDSSTSVGCHFREGGVGRCVAEFAIAIDDKDSRTCAVVRNDHRTFLVADGHQVPCAFETVCVQTFGALVREAGGRFVAAGAEHEKAGNRSQGKNLVSHRNPQLNVFFGI